MKKVVIIPARWGSSRLEGKPLRKIAGKAMIQRVCERCLQARNVDDVVVATDDERIVEAVEAFGAKAVMTGLENRSGTDRAADAARRMGLSEGDLIINIQGDQPMIEPVCIDEVIQPFMEDPGLEMATLGFRIVDEREITDPKDVKLVMDHDGFALYFSRAPIPHPRDAGTNPDYYKHLGVYAYKRGFLETFRDLSSGILEEIEKLEQLRVLEHGHRIKVVITEHDSPEVDLDLDIARIEEKLKAADPA